LSEISCQNAFLYVVDIRRDVYSVIELYTYLLQNTFQLIPNIICRFNMSIVDVVFVTPLTLRAFSLILIVSVHQREMITISMNKLSYCICCFGYFVFGPHE
jgi:hypothetical protein